MLNKLILGRCIIYKNIIKVFLWTELKMQVFCKKTYSGKFRKAYKKTPVSESLFKKAGCR